MQQSLQKFVKLNLSFLRLPEKTRFMDSMSKLIIDHVFQNSPVFECRRGITNLANCKHPVFGVEESFASERKMIAIVTFQMQH